MPEFRYEAIRVDGRRVGGSAQAADRSEVVAWLQQQKSLPLWVVPRSARSLLRLPRLRSGRNLLVATSELKTLIAAGMTIDRP